MVRVEFLHKGNKMGFLINEFCIEDFVIACEKSGIDPSDVEVTNTQQLSEYEVWEHYHSTLKLTTFKKTHSNEEIERVMNMEDISYKKINGMPLNRNVILYSEDYRPTDDVVEYANKLGYTDIKSIECRMDFRFVNYIFQKLESYHNLDMCKGKKTLIKKCGCKGFAYIREVDITQEWTIHYNMRGDFKSLNGNFEEVLYIKRKKYSNNFTTITLS